MLTGFGQSHGNASWPRGSRYEWQNETKAGWRMSEYERLMAAKSKIESWESTNGNRDRLTGDFVRRFLDSLADITEDTPPSRYAVAMEVAESLVGAWE